MLSKIMIVIIHKREKIDSNSGCEFIAAFSIVLKCKLKVDIIIDLFCIIRIRKTIRLSDILAKVDIHSQ